MRKLNYAALFTLRSDGRYQGYWHELDRNGEPTGPRHTICDKDPQRLFERIREKETPGRKTLADVAEEYEQRHREEVKDRTWVNYAPHLADIVAIYGRTPIAQLTALDVSQDLQAAKAAGYGRTVVNTRRTIWNGLFNSAIASRDIPFNPATAVKLPKGLKSGKRSAPPDEVLTEILSCAEDMNFGFIPFFLLCTGLRLNEALRRPVSDLDTKSWVLRITESKTEAGIRTVPIIAPLREPLKKWLAAHPGAWIFPRMDYYAGRRGRETHMTESNWYTAWAKFCAERGWIDGEGKVIWTAHHLRHGTATLLYEAGVDVYTAQHILGHANVRTTMEIYTELRQAHEKKNVGKFGKKMGKMIAKAEKSR